MLTEVSLYSGLFKGALVLVVAIEHSTQLFVAFSHHVWFMGRITPRHGIRWYMGGVVASLLWSVMKSIAEGYIAHSMAAVGAYTINTAAAINTAPVSATSNETYIYLT